MSASSTTPERLYQMTRIQAGDYILPSNDLRRLWRITRYREGGSWPDRTRGFWRLSRFHGTAEQAAKLIETDVDQFLSWEEWEEWDWNLPTRQAAIDVAIRT